MKIGSLNVYRKLFKTPLQFRLARTSNCHAGQIAVTSLLKGTFEELPEAMKSNIAYKFELMPTREQKRILAQAAGCRRFV